MIKPSTRVKVADNTGAREVMCIRVLRPGKSSSGRLGDVIVGSVKSASPQSPVKKKEVVRGVIIRTKAPHNRPDGTSIRFDDNAVVLINPDNSPRGSRILGPVARELRERGFGKIISQSPEVL